MYFYGFFPHLGGLKQFHEDILFQASGRGIPPCRDENFYM